jgi:hypothetical protein
MSAHAGPRRPNFFIVGAPKTGTTSLYEYIEGHPDVFMSPVKEPNFFSPDVMGPHRRSRWKYPDEMDGYLTLYEEARSEKVVGEASTSYLVSHVAPQAVSEVAPEAKILVMVRNPIDVMQALHSEMSSAGADPIADFVEAARADDDRREGRRLPPGYNALGLTYHDNALLGEQLQRWLAAFPREQIHVIVFEDFAADTAREFRRVLEFLGVDPSWAPASFGARNASWKRRSGLVPRLIRTRPARWLRHSVVPRVIGENRAMRYSSRLRHSRLHRERRERPAIPDSYRQELEGFFARDVAKLGSLIGRDLQAEWFKRTASAGL